MKEAAEGEEAGEEQANTDKKVNALKESPLSKSDIHSSGFPYDTYEAAEYQPISFTVLNSSVKVGTVTATMVVS